MPPQSDNKKTDNKKTDKKKSDERARAARILTRVIGHGKTTDQSFGSEKQDPLTLELVYGTLRHYYSLQATISQLLQQKIRNKDQDLFCLMLVGAYQLNYTRIPDHAAINQTVDACVALRKPWAKGLVNAILRNLLRKNAQAIQSNSREPSENSPEQSFELPAWMITRLQSQYDRLAPAIMLASLQRAPMSLRINLIRNSRADYQLMLNEQGIENHEGWMEENIILDTALPARELPGFKEGTVSVQDAGAMFAADLLQPQNPSAYLLDACAAPGGKLFHLAERLPAAELIGLELSETRVEHMRSEAQRLGHHELTLICGDATNLEWWSHRQFDAILLDAPCSGSGTLRRHPDIKILRNAGSIEDYANLQLALLRNLWQTLAPGGQLLYCTCSLFQEENDAVIETFLQQTEDADSRPINLPVGRATTYGWQLYPEQSIPDTPNRTVDGFYYACVTRQLKPS